MPRYLFFALLLLATAPARAAEPPADPILRLETGMHTAAIWRIATDAQGRWLATASEDKTLRLWDLHSGALLKTFRPPLGSGDEGKLYAVAMAPDGAWLATAGWTVGWDENEKDSVYIFGRTNGAMTRRLDGLENVVNHLCVSPDGRRLGATFGAGWGVQVWDTQSWNLTFKDTDYDDNSHWCDFAPDNRLLTTSLDGNLRLYQSQGDSFQLFAKNIAPGGQQPYAAVFSPDGTRIAVGFGDSTAVNVLETYNLNLLYAPNTDEVNNGSLNSVAWSGNGQILYAGGMYAPGDIKPILAWPQAGQGTYTPWPGALDTLMDIRTLSDGRVIYGAGDPTWAVLHEGTKLLERTAVIADYRDNWDGFRVAADGSRVAFGFEQWGKRPAHFEVLSQNLILNPPDDPALVAPDTQSLNVTDWKYTDSPQLNGTPLALKQYERSRALAITPDASHFALGTEWNVYLFDNNGAQIWKMPAPSVAWAVNISGDNQKVLAAFGDGTIRWYRLSDGEELLAFFPHKDGRRWVAWTPSGYYTASAGADNLIGWHVNRGKDAAAAFYPASALYQNYKRPDVVQKILFSLDEAEALRLANLENPDAGSGGDKKTLLDSMSARYQIRPEPSGLGRAVIVAAGGEQDSNTLFPYSNENTQEMYRLLHRIGFSDGDILYLNPLPPVVPADGYVDDTRRDYRLSDDPGAELAAAVAEAVRDLRAGQQFVFYLHGHARPDYLRLSRDSELSAAQLREVLAQVPDGVEQIVILDTCYAGSFLDDLAGTPGRTVIAAADAETESWSSEYGSFSGEFIRQLKHGLALKDAFDGAVAKMRRRPKVFGDQTPWLDDDGDGQPNTSRDGIAAAGTYLGLQKYHGGLAPEITAVHPHLPLAEGQNDALLWVKTVPGFDGMRQVRALLLNEKDDAARYFGIDTDFSRRELQLMPNHTTGRWEGAYVGFARAEAWRVLYQAQSLEGDWSDIATGYVGAAPEAAPALRVLPKLNQSRFVPGDTLRLSVEAEAEQNVDLYVGLIYPAGYFQTVTGSPGLSLVNVLAPFRTDLNLSGTQTLDVLELELPALMPGDYQVCGLLTMPKADPWHAAEWLAFGCSGFGM